VRALEDRVALSPFAVVTTTANSGPGSLRQVIALVNADTSANQDEIAFNIPTTDPGYNPTTGLYTIGLATDLPKIRHPISLDGETQPGFTNSPVVVLQGESGAPRGLYVDATSAVFSSFAATVDSLTLQFVGNGIEVNDAGSASSIQVNLLNDQIPSTKNGTAAAPTAGILFYAGDSSNSLTVSDSQINVQGLFASGMSIYTGGTSTSATLTNNQVTCQVSSGASGVPVVVYEARGATVDTLTLTGNSLTCSRHTSLILNLVDASNTVELSQNTFTAINGVGCSVVCQPTSASDTASVNVSNNVFVTTTSVPHGSGFGLQVSASAGLQLLVQGNDFSQIGKGGHGIDIQGDDTTAGVVDLGGGSLGSTGGNIFTAFTRVPHPPVGNPYAIGLFGVSSDYTVYAQDNTWGVSDPTTVIADGIHNPQVGGSGLILT
jgi:hypothetical protein